MNKAIFIIILLFFALSTNAFGQSLETRIQNLEMKILDLELRILELEKALLLESGSFEIEPTTREPVQSEKWQLRANWRNLQQGMTMSEIRSLLGEPHNVSKTSLFTQWYYQLGSVSFNERGVVTGWSEPFDLK